MECQSEAIEDDAEAQHFLRAELDAGDPRLGQIVAERVGVEHAEDDTDDHRAERQILEKLGFADVEGCARKECNQKYAMNHADTFFCKLWHS